MIDAAEYRADDVLELPKPKSHYAQLVWEWTRMWQAGLVPTDEFNKLLAMQTGWWQRGLQKPNDDMIAQLESWIAIYRKQNGAPANGDDPAPQEEIF